MDLRGRSVRSLCLTFCDLCVFLEGFYNFSASVDCMSRENIIRV